MIPYKWSAFGLFCLGAMTASNTALAACGTVNSIPAFTATVDSSKAPAPPNPLSLSNLELFRVQLELYRDNTVEGYNRKLTSYSTQLTRLDQTARNAAANGKCSQQEYETWRSQISDQLDKVGGEYLEPYREGQNVYKRFYEWYKTQSRVVRLRQQMQG